MVCSKGVGMKSGTMVIRLGRTSALDMYSEFLMSAASYGMQATAVHDHENNSLRV